MTMLKRCHHCPEHGEFPCHQPTPIEGSWEEEFDEEYGDLPLEQWAVGFVAAVMTENDARPKFGEGSDRSFLTKKLEEKFREQIAITRREERAAIIKFLRETPNPYMVPATLERFVSDLASLRIPE